MKRLLIVVAVLALSLGAAWAQMQEMQEPIPPCARNWEDAAAQGPMARMMGAVDTATHGGYIYILQGNVLEKHDMDGNVLKAIELDDLKQTLEEIEDEGTCPVCGMPMDVTGGEGRPAGGPGEGRGMMMGGGRGMMMGGGQGMMHGGGPMVDRRMRGMQARHMYGCVRLSADEEGVYLLRGGRMTVFDHDLNRQNSWRVSMEDCPAHQRVRQMAMQKMRGTSCPTCRMHAGREIDERSITNGYVRMWHRPVVLTPGPARINISVHELDLSPDNDAAVSGYLYPNDNPDDGLGLQMESVGGGQYYATVDIPAEGQWELAVRIMRPGEEDVRVYYNVPVGAPMN